MDGDGDMDVLSASSGDDISSNDHKIVWYENTDGNGIFSTQKIITIQASGTGSNNDGEVKCGKPGVDTLIRYPCYCKLNIHMVNVFLPPT